MRRLLDGSLLRGAPPAFDLGEGLLDQIEVGRIGWQISDRGAEGTDHLANVRAEIVHDDDVAG